MNILKHLAYSVGCMAIVAMGLTSCSQEDMPDTPTREGMVDVVMTTSMPQELESYAVNSAQGGLQNLEDKGYSVRYIMEIYPKNSTEMVKRMINYVPMSAGGSYKTTSFNLRLLAAEYNFVFFADIVRQVNDYPYAGDSRVEAMLSGMNLSKPYYANRYFFSGGKDDKENDVLVRPTDVDQATTGNLLTISACPNATDTFQNHYLEMYDAYSCSELVDLRTEPTTQSFTLKRPFAKLRLITTDADQLLATPDWSKSRVDISVSDIPTGINALTGETITTGANGYWNSGTQALNSDVYSDENGNDKTLSVFYLPVPANSQNLTFTISVKDNSGNYLTRSLKLEVQNVPLVGNKLTTIKGNLLSKNATFDVTIEDEFDNVEEDENGNLGGTDQNIFIGEVSSLDDLKASLTGGSDVITYFGNVSKEEGFELDFTKISRSVPLYSEDNKATLTLNLLNVEEGAVITFIGKGNSPKAIRLNTTSKCSLRADMPTTTSVSLGGSSYKYILYNCPTKTLNRPAIDAVFVTDFDNAAWVVNSNRSDCHFVDLNSSFGLIENSSCGNFVHNSDNCTFISTITTWLNSNSGKTVWDFVGDTKN